MSRVSNVVATSRPTCPRPENKLEKGKQIKALIIANLQRTSEATSRLPGDRPAEQKM
jgi:hypothetical protein